MGGAIRGRGLRLGALVAASVVLLTTSLALAAPTFPAPGTASAIARAVAASTKITKLSSALVKQMPNAPNDNAAVDYPKTRGGCPKLTSCVFGDLKSKHDLVVLGDSHAQMWIPAVARIGVALKMKVIILFLARCPAASLDVWLTVYNAPYTACTSTRSSWITALNKLHPVTILLADHTNGVYSAASNGTQLFTSAQWQTGMQTTITDLKPSGAHVAILGDTVTFDLPPVQCLAANPTNVQSCSSPTPNPDRPGQQTAERAAATADGVLYVDPTRWLCTATTCSPVVGNYIVYFDTYHLSCRYAAYLSGVLQTALKKVL